MTLPAQRAFATPPAADIERRLAAVMEQEKISGLHALLVSQHGKTIFEHYQPGDDQDRAGTPLPDVQFGPDVPHDLRSVSKSVIGLLYGIALADGKVPPPEAKLYAQFPEYADLAGQPGRDKLTMAHVLSMTLGLQWDELTIPYGTAGNSENAMDDAPDRFRYILSLPIVMEPGTKWVYCGAATAILGHLIERGTGMKMIDYAREKLFTPMGFGHTEWALDLKGELIAASGLRLRPRDLLKIAELTLAGGKWQDKQLVPADWVKTITAAKIRIDERRSYGYQWYLGELKAPGQSQTHPWIAGIGWGGQWIFVLPDHQAAVAINCGNYAKPGPEQGRTVFTILVAVVLPLLAA
ncbi:MAG TPA: serine hydrolase domain-containing protein [Reyranella sp.]|nr:serine hydrolase domain-containing protein [Reyranella sp.]